MITRFAPSPTGPLHLGHAYSALLAHDMARSADGRFLLRIEDIDQSRARPAWEAQIYDDLAWLGLTWETPVMRQSDRLDVYRETLNQMWWDGLLYACRCNRADIRAAASAPQEGVSYGPDGIIYPATCRNLPEDRDHYPAAPPADAALRLDLTTVPKGLFDGTGLSFLETGAPNGNHTVTLNALTSKVGDIVLSRRDIGTSYHLSVVLDDAAQGVTHVLRGADLFEATQIHVLLQAVLGLPTPTYHHHRLIRDDHGKRLAKRDDARSLAKYRADGATPNDIRRMVGLLPEG
ncbi:tRNA glutamyl-Q(34) synthetase GluQRS [Yoonia sp. R2331]|uniref:tRNA glutamyl-Q(34) synthetase GluQRS n=1 Tax=Yoonia sp. R2331 TaxID=3237238 RepID=UPI0034E470C0